MTMPPCKIHTPEIKSGPAYDTEQVTVRIDCDGKTYTLTVYQSNDQNVHIDLKYPDGEVVGLESLNSFG